MSEAIARGRIFAPGFFTDPVIRAAYLGSEWIGPSQGQLDPIKEIEAEILSCEHGFSTHEQSTIRINGGEWDRNMEQLARERGKLAEIGGETAKDERVFTGSADE
jgi:capsid protein